MGLREKLEDRIKKKEQEILELEIKIREAKAYLQALHDSIRLLPRKEVTLGEAESVLRPGSNIAKTYELLKKEGRPMHITEILKGIGKSATKKEKISLSGSLSWYVRRKEIFSRPAPNTFGLINVEEKETYNEEPPEEFGLEEENTK